MVERFKSSFTGPSGPAVLLHWLRERDRVARGLDSDDEIIQRGRFCQVRRQDDRGTRWLHENWLEPHRDDPDAWFLALVFRCCINDGRVAGEITCPLPWDGPRYLAEMVARDAEGKYTEHFGHRAYTKYTYPGYDFKPEGHVACLLNRAWAKKSDLRPKKGDTCATVYRRLIKLDGVGSFGAGQIVADCKFLPPLSEASDVMTFAAPGPGSVPGLARVRGKQLGHYKNKEPAWRRDFNELYAQLAPEIERILGEPLSASDLQSALCEINKLERYRIDGGRIQIYKPFSETPAKPPRKARPTPSVEGTVRNVQTSAAIEPQAAAQYPRGLFTNLAKPCIVPAPGKSSGLRLVFDIETDNLLATATKVHCIVIADLDSEQIDEYGPEQIASALAHLKRADYLTGHNICGYDLPLLYRLYDWTPASGCTVLDTLVASRLILPHLSDLDTKVKAITGASLGELHGRHKLEAWGARTRYRKERDRHRSLVRMDASGAGALRQ